MPAAHRTRAVGRIRCANKGEGQSLEAEVPAVRHAGPCLELRHAIRQRCLNASWGCFEYSGRSGGEYRNRTGVHGFAIRCVTTPPTRQSGVPIRFFDTEGQADCCRRQRCSGGRCVGGPGPHALQGRISRNMNDPHNDARNNEVVTYVGGRVSVALEPTGPS